MFHWDDLNQDQQSEITWIFVWERHYSSAYLMYCDEDLATNNYNNSIDQ